MQIIDLLTASELLGISKNGVLNYVYQKRLEPLDANSKSKRFDLMIFLKFVQLTKPEKYHSIVKQLINLGYSITSDF